MDKVRVHDDLGLDVQRQDGLWLEPSQAHIKLIRLREGSGVCVYYCSRNHTTPTIAVNNYYTVASATSPTISTGPTATKIATDHTNPYLCSCQSYHHRTTTTTTAFKASSTTADATTTGLAVLYCNHYYYYRNDHNYVCCDPNGGFYCHVVCFFLLTPRSMTSVLAVSVDIAPSNINSRCNTLSVGIDICTRGTHPREKGRSKGDQRR